VKLPLCNILWYDLHCYINLITVTQNLYLNIRCRSLDFSATVGVAQEIREEYVTLRFRHHRGVEISSDDCWLRWHWWECAPKKSLPCKVCRGIDISEGEWASMTIFDEYVKDSAFFENLQESWWCCMVNEGGSIWCDIYVPWPDSLPFMGHRI